MYRCREPYSGMKVLTHYLIELVRRSASKHSDTLCVVETMFLRCGGGERQIVTWFTAMGEGGAGVAELRPFRRIRIFAIILRCATVFFVFSSMAKGVLASFLVCAQGLISLSQYRGISDCWRSSRRARRASAMAHAHMVLRMATIS